MKNFEPFLGLAGLATELASRLDRNFRQLFTDLSIIAITDDYTLKITDNVGSIHADASTAALSVFLPDQPSGNRRITVTKIDSSANIVTIDAGANLINGFSQQQLGAQYDSYTLEPTGTGWLIVACVP